MLTLCGNSDYDTKLYVYENVCPSGPHACNDDFCSTPSFLSPFVSALSNVALTAGNTYYIVVDGFAGAAGNYTLDVTGFAPPPPGLTDCPPDSLFGQPPSNPNDAWTFGIADENGTGFGGAGLNESFTVIPIQIYAWSIDSRREFQANAAAAIIVLMVGVMALNLLAAVIRERFRRN